MTTKLYALHNGVVFNQLADVVAILIANRKLSSKENERLQQALAAIDAQLGDARPLVAGLLDRMKPLLSSGK